MTEKAVKYVIDVLEQEKITYHVHRVPEDSWGTVLASVWTSTGVILAMPTYEFKIFPPMAAVLEEIGKKRPLTGRHSGSVLMVGVAVQKRTLWKSWISTL